jgi:hypothetical protein
MTLTSLSPSRSFIPFPPTARPLLVDEKLESHAHFNESTAQLFDYSRSSSFSTFFAPFSRVAPAPARSIQQALRVYARAIVNRWSEPESHRNMFNHYQQHESRIVAHFSLRKFPLGSAREGKSEHESEPKLSNRTNTDARQDFQ